MTLATAPYNGSMMAALLADDDDLYREIILEHYRAPRHHADIPTEAAGVVANNPLCGDELRLSGSLDDTSVLSSIHFDGQGCSICLASASIMCEWVDGKAAQDIHQMSGQVREMLRSTTSSPLGGDLDALLGVRQYPARVKCASLAWTAMEELLSTLTPGVTGTTKGSIDVCH